MHNTMNDLGQPIDLEVTHWNPPEPPSREPMEGRFCRLEPLEPDIHAEALYAANRLDLDGRMWTYLSYGPFHTYDSYRAWIDKTCRGNDPLFFAIIDHATNNPVGVASYTRIDPRAGSIEVGHLGFSPLLQRKPAATEAMFLMMDRAFSLGYRRYEWKCSPLNAPSRAAAQRLGLTFEGIFRQAAVFKGRNRDHAWYAAIDKEWPALREAFARWLSPDNFDAQGKQKIRLSNLTSSSLVRRE